VSAQDHFDGQFEVEKKFCHVDLTALREKLIAAGAEAFIEGGAETDIYLDREDHQLSRANQAFIIRELRPSNRVLLISKGPQEDACTAIETRQFLKAQEMFFGLGYHEIRRIEKKRDVYFLGACHITLDDVPPFGQFAEVAIVAKSEAELPAARKAVDLAIEQLGLSQAQVEHRSYAQMFDALKA
jgi:adenylate cyclase class 2